MMLLSPPPPSPPPLLHFMERISPFVFLSLFKEGWGRRNVHVASIWKNTYRRGREMCSNTLLSMRICRHYGNTENGKGCAAARAVEEFRSIPYM